MIRSARGEMIDTALHAIKAQLAQRPVPSPVAARQVEIAEREGKSVAVILPPVVPAPEVEPVFTAELSEMMAAAAEDNAIKKKATK